MICLGETRQLQWAFVHPRMLHIGYSWYNCFKRIAQLSFLEHVSHTQLKEAQNEAIKKRCTNRIQAPLKARCNRNVAFRKLNPTRVEFTTRTTICCHSSAENRMKDTASGWKQRNLQITKDCSQKNSTKPWRFECL